MTSYAFGETLEVLRHHRAKSRCHAPYVSTFLAYESCNLNIYDYKHLIIIYNYSQYKKFKKIYKRNIPNVGMGGWMEALADKVHKQGEHIPQHCYISHNHPYISSSDTLGGTISISTAT